MTFRQQEINVWLSNLFPNEQINTKYLQSDASARQYLRLQLPHISYVIMDTKPDQELINFIQIAKILHAHKITVPEIIHGNMQAGLILMSDFGSETYQTALEQSPANKIDSLYLDALNTLVKIQQIDVAGLLDYTFPVMQEEYIKVRLEVFSTWYLQTHLSMNIDNNVLQCLEKMQQLFCKVYTELPQALVHVDYHCRNLMVIPNNNPGVLDFQDAMYGPITYDLASLFQDAYITWPRAKVETWLATYYDIAVATKIMPAISFEAFLRNFDLVGLHRHLKNLGVFARLHHRDNKSNYLPHIPVLLQYIHETCNRYNELSWLQEFIMEEVQG